MTALKPRTKSLSCPLAYLLNRFYIGEVVYRGEIHSGDHVPILDRDLFEAAQARLAAQAVQRLNLDGWVNWANFISDRFEHWISS